MRTLSCLLLAGATVAGAADAPARPMAWRGVHVMVSGSAFPLLKRLIVEKLAPLGYNVLVPEVDYGFAWQSHPELRSGDPLTAEQAHELARACREHRIRLIPQFQCLGHQSWAKSTAELLTKYPQFDETPGLPFDNPGIYCRSWCPLNPEVNPVVFALMDELLDAFEADALHVGMDEVFLIGDDRCPRCRGKDKAELFARAVNDYHHHLVDERKVEMLMWSDRFLDAKAMGYSEWDASANGTAPAVDRVPRDIVMCDWHYDYRAQYPSIPFFLQKGFRVWPSGWRETRASLAFLRDSQRYDDPKMLGHLFTTWLGAASLAKVLLAEPDAEREGQQAHQVAAVMTIGIKVANGETVDEQAALDEAFAVELRTDPLLRELQRPPDAARVLMALDPATLAPTLQTTSAWTGAVVPKAKPAALRLSYPNATPSKDGQGFELTLRFRVPELHGKPALQVFLNDTLHPSEWMAYRFWQVLAGDKVLWEEDMALDRAAGKAWTTVDLSAVAKPGEELALRLRGTDKRGVYDYSTVAYVGPARLVELP